MQTKLKIIGIVLLILLVIGGYFYFKYYFTYEDKNITQRKIEAITGQDLTVSIFGLDGKLIKRWVHVQKISAAKEERNYTFFYTKENKYVQIPDSVWYIAEEE
ncbi:MAG: hypothetical protein GY754_16080 [bacterium]|nr:hypothetical protein [bacterium]